MPIMGRDRKQKIIIIIQKVFIQFHLIVHQTQIHAVFFDVQCNLTI